MLEKEVRLIDANAPKRKLVSMWQAAIIIALSENNRIVERTAKKLGVRGSTLDYHIRAIQDKTAKDPLNVNDIKELLPLAHDVLLCGSESLRPHGKWEQCFEDWRKQIEG